MRQSCNIHSQKRVRSGIPLTKNASKEHGYYCCPLKLFEKRKKAGQHTSRVVFSSVEITFALSKEPFYGCYDDSI